MRIAVIGGVNSTAILIKKLYEHNFEFTKIWAYKPKKQSNVSGWEDLSILAKEFDYKYQQFSQVKEISGDLKIFKPDYIFVVGLSQIIPDYILEIPKYGCIGFHPTSLPKGRGRAPIAWLVLEESDGAATFFWLKSGVDDGAIIEQVNFSFTEGDNAAIITKKCLEAEKIALDKLLKKIKNLEIKSFEQDIKEATWFGKRTPEDGLINWSESAFYIDKLVRATTEPHPGAFTFHEKEKIYIWETKKILLPIKGVIGRILDVENDMSFKVQTGNGLIEIQKWSANIWRPKVGMKLGYYSEIEIYKLNAEIVKLKSILNKIESKLSNLEENKS